MSNEALADLLGLTGTWRAAMLAVPREVFVPPKGMVSPEDGSGRYPIDRSARPEEWLRAVYSDASITIQRADGRGDPADTSTGIASSSISAPGIVFEFLRLLDPLDGDRVLDIGTGSGYTAAVLSARLGADNVTSIEVDPQVAEQAAVNLKTAGYAPRLLVGDGTAGYPAGAPYDRVHATCAVAQIPYAWVEQTRPGGIIVAPWQPRRGHGHKVALRRTGSVARGRFHGPCGYMMLRGQRATLRWKAHHHDAAEVSTTSLDPRTVAQAGAGATLFATMRAPGLGAFTETEDDGSFSLLLYEIGNPAGSWAACDYEPGKTASEVTQYGDRRLWDELAAAYADWLTLGQPGIERFGLAVTPARHELWLDDPGNIVARV